MIARVGVTSLSSTTAVVRRIESTPMPTPITAVISGRPAAISEPKVSSSTTKATARPTTSLVALMAIGSPKPAPPASTCRPCSRPSSMAS